MPLHDWRDERGWDTVHLYWIAYLSVWLKPRLPSGFRAYPGNVPGLSIQFEGARPDVSVRRWQPDAPAATSPSATTELIAPDYRGIARAATDPQLAVLITAHGQLVAAIEIVSPRNKDRLSAQKQYKSRYAGYILEGWNLLLVDALPRPVNFSFADEVAAELEYDQPPCPTPHAVSWSVGGALPEGGRPIEVWQRKLTIGQPLPTIPLGLTADHHINVDLEPSYAQAAADAYCE